MPKSRCPRHKPDPDATKCDPRTEYYNSCGSQCDEQYCDPKREVKVCDLNPPVAQRRRLDATISRVMEAVDARRATLVMHKTAAYASRTALCIENKRF